ncbi:MAG: helicase [Candidatus Hydrogenedentes bacterium]|nr:helicase [Candidatus Hydrogenedentota bacterium]
MPKLNTFDVVIKTGANGPAALPKWAINGFVVEFEQSKGGNGPGETFEGTANPGSFPHSLLIRGPESGQWDIEETKVTYYPNGESPYTVRLGAARLDEESDLNIWHERPQAVFDV